MAHPASNYLGEQRRRSTRLNQTIPINVRGVDLLGQPFEERATTQALSFHGCSYHSRHHLPKNMWVTLEVPAGHGRKEPLCVRARVAWIHRPKTLRELFHVGVELESGGNIWGISSVPEDWSSEASLVDSAPAGFTAHSQNAAYVMTERNIVGNLETEGSLDTHFDRLLAEAATEQEIISAENAARAASTDSTLLQELQNQFDSQTQKVIEEAQARAEQLVREHSSEWQREQRATAEEFYQRWREEFEREQAGAKDEISSELEKQMASQVAQMQQQVQQEMLASLQRESQAWRDAAGTALAEWREQSEFLRREARLASEQIVGGAEQRLEEKFAQQLEELRVELLASGLATPVPDGQAAPIPAEMREEWRRELDSQMGVTRGQWNELLESSVDSAAQRLVSRLSEDSQRLLQSSDERLAARVVELEQQSVRAAEQARAAFEDVRRSFAEELDRAKASFAEIEQAAAHFSEYSRQLEAASHDSLNQLRKRLEESLNSRTAEMERRANDLLKQFGERSALLLDQLNQAAASRATAEAEAKIAPALERAAEATRQLETREQQAEEILRIHRERLRQVSEQGHREVSSQLSGALAMLGGELEGARNEALKKWAAELESSSARVAQESSSAMKDMAEWQMQEAVSRLKLQTQENFQRTQEQMEEALQALSARSLSEWDAVEAAHLESARGKLSDAAEEQVAASRNSISLAAEVAASRFGEVIRETSDAALKNFSAESDAKAEQGRARLVAAAEQVLQSFDEHAHSSLTQFQDQLAARIDQRLAQTNQDLSSRLQATLEIFQNHGESDLQEWSGKQEALSAEALSRHEENLHRASDSWLSSSIEQLHALGRSRVDAFARTAEEAIHKVCVQVFEEIAQTLREKLMNAPASARDARPQSLMESGGLEHHASA